MDQSSQLNEIARNTRRAADSSCCANTPYTYIGLASQNPVVVKASAGVVENVTAFNINAAPVYLKLYDKATAPSSSDTPVQVYIIPGNTAAAGFTINPNIRFSLGISFRMVGGIANNNTTNTSASEQTVNIAYQ